MGFQQKVKSLIEIVKEKPKDYSMKQFHGVGKTYSLICRQMKIVIPKQVKKSLVEWCRNMLCQQGETRAKLTIGQHFHWKDILKMIRYLCSKCHNCQFLKRNKRNYGELSHQEIES